MKLEHRYHARKSACLEVVIFHRPLGLVRGIVTNVGAEGAFVDTGAVVLPVDAVVELAFVTGRRPRAQLHRVRAVVAHNRNRGAGLMFCDAPDGGTGRIIETAQNRLDAA